jgi:RHS repeat-associated protein
VFRMAGAVRLATRRKGRSPMRSALAREIVDVVLLGGVPALIACSSEPIGDFAVEKSQAISLAERILGFEGSVGPAGDWRPSTGQVASTSTSGEGAKSLSLGADWNPSSTSVALGSLGSLSGAPTIDVRLPSGYACQGSYCGQVALFITCPSGNLFNQYVGPSALHGPAGTFQRYTLPAFSEQVRAALTTKSDCTVRVQLNLSNSGGLPVLVDRLNLGQTANGGPGGSSSGGAPGLGGSPTGGGGAPSGGVPAGGSSTGGSLPSGGVSAGGSTGGAASGGTGSPRDVEFFIELPHRVDRSEVALASYGGPLELRDGFQVVDDSTAFASVSSVNSAISTRLGVEAAAQSLWSQAAVVLADRAVVHGNLRTQGALSASPIASIVGTSTSGTSLDPVRRYAWIVRFPTPHLGDISLEPGATATITAGPHGSLNIKTGAILKLASPGRYTFDGSITLEPGATLEVDNRMGGVELYAATGLIFRGALARLDPAKNNLLIGIAGPEPIPVESSFRGVLVAPNANVTLATVSGGHRGSVFAKSIWAEAHSSISHEPFTDDTCSSEAVCDGRCPCEAGHGPCDDNGDCDATITCGEGACGGPTADCSSDSECSPGLKCLADKCTDPCVQNPTAAGCDPAYCSDGVLNQDEWAIDCGPSCANQDCRGPLTPCAVDADCGAGSVCSSEAAVALGVLTTSVKVCWNSVCSTGSGDCGSVTATCGYCLCEPSCDGKECGGALDGCSSLCAGVCSSAQPGCRSDFDCPSDHVCLPNAEARYGTPAGQSVCVPSDCFRSDLSAADCGTVEARCGATCPPVYEPCAGMTCGKDPRTGVECGTCGPGLVCNLSNACGVPEPQIPAAEPRQVAYEVGVTPGQHTVTPLGLSAYRIPLRLPPGVRGLAPELALVFSDLASMRGALGPGWSLAGVSQIHRCSVPTTQTIGIFAALPQEPLPTSFCLDGRPLRLDSVLTEAANDPNTEVFRLADYDASKIVFHRDSLTFEQFEPDGVVRLFGDSEASRRRVWAGSSVDPANSVEKTAVDSWHLSRSQDRFGNQVRYRFDTEGVGGSFNVVHRSIRLTQIEYAGKGPETFRRRVHFGYRDKGDVLSRTSGFYRGVEVDDSKLLEEIRVDTFDGSVLIEGARVYRIGYEAAPANGVQRVQGVRECAATEAGEKCLPPTLFTYDDASPPEGEVLAPRFGSPQEGILASGSGNINFVRRIDEPTLNPAFPLDGDGDGLKDLIQLDRSLGGGQFFHATLSPNGKIKFEAPTELPVSVFGCISAATIADLDGDGRDELLDECSQSSGSKRVRYFNINASGEVGVATTSMKTLGRLSLADIDGNGRPDIVQEVGEHIYFGDFGGFSDEGTMLFRLSRVSGQGNLSPETPASFARSLFLVDVDGDGTANLLRFSPERTEYLALSLKHPGTLTEDERGLPTTGVIEDPEDPRIYMQRIAQWRPTGLKYQSSPLEGGEFNHFKTVRVLDVNGDGLSDLWVQTFVQRIPTDPNVLPDEVDVFFPHIGGLIAEANMIGGLFAPKGIVEPGPAHLWINQGGYFMPKVSVVGKFDGEPAPDVDECAFPTPEGKCPLLQSTTFFQNAAVLDYDSDGRDELLIQWPRPGDDHEFRWRRVSLESETSNSVELSVQSIPRLPSSEDLYRDPPGEPRLQVASTLPIWSDFDGDTNLDMLIVGQEDDVETRLLVMGQGRGQGRRLTGITDGLGNQQRISHAEARKVVDMGGTCGAPYAQNAPRCLRSMGALVSSVERGDLSGRDFGSTRYTYEQPATADFLRGYYFAARTIAEEPDESVDGEIGVSLTREEYGQALENSVWGSEYTYPFLRSPTTRHTRLAKAPDLNGVDRERTILEEQEFRLTTIPEDTAYLLHRRTTTSDETDVGELPVLTVDEVFDVDYDGLPSGREQSIDAGGWPTIASSKVEIIRDSDRERWILDKVERVVETHSRGGQRSVRTTRYDHDLETGFVTSMTENRDDEERWLISEFSPDDFGNVSTVTQHSADGDRLTYVDYGSSGIFPRTVQNPGGHVQHFEFDDVWGAPTLAETASGFKTLQAYDGFGRPTRRETLNGTVRVLLAEQTYSAVAPYEVAGRQVPAAFRVSVASDLFSGEHTTDYDSRQLPVRSKVLGVSVGGTTPDLFGEVEYDWAGRVTRKARPHLDGDDPVWTVATYDKRGRLNFVDAPRGDLSYRYGSHVHFASQFPDWAVDDGFELTHVTDENGIEDVSIEDYLGEPVLTAQGVGLAAGISGYVSRVVHGPLDLPVALIDPELHETAIERNSDGQVTALEDENRGRTEYKYDAYGNVRDELQADGVSSVFTYDKLDRLLTRTDDGQDRSEWVYDQDVPGTLSYMVGPTGVRTEFGYESSPRAAQNLMRQMIGERTFTTESEYDRLGRVERVSYPVTPQSAQNVHFAVRPVYDEYSGEQVGVTSDNGSTQYWKVSAVDYQNQTSEITLGNGVREIESFDRDTGRLKNTRTLNASDTELNQLSYGYYDNGQLLERKLKFDGDTRTRTYTYDAARRLSGVLESGVETSTETFGFTPSGKLASRSKQGNQPYSRSYEYEPSRPHAPSSVGTNVFGYDVRGNQEARSGPDVPGGEQTIAYNRFNLPDRIDIGVSTDPDESLLFEYDATGSRVARRAMESGVEVLTEGDLYEATGEIGGDIQEHKLRIFARGREIAQITYNQQTDAPETRYLHRDHLASVIFTTNGDGEPSALTDYDAFGAPIETPTASTPLESFGGHQLDPTAGLLYGGARLYDPTFGVFTSPDPLRISGGGSQAFNPYAYANNDPINWFDPTGYASEDPTEIIVRGERQPYYPGIGQPGIPGAVWYEGTPTVFVAGCRSGASCPQSSIDAGWAAEQAAKSQAAAEARRSGDVVDRDAFFNHPFPHTERTYDTIGASLTIGLNVVNVVQGLRSILTAGLRAVLTRVGVRAAAREVGSAGQHPLTAINPLSGTTNCVNCAVALNATLGGSRASATLGGAVPLGRVPAVFGRVGFDGVSSGISGVETALLNAGSGSRAVVVGIGPSGGHAFNAVNRGGVIQLLDGQIGGAAVVDAFTSFRWILNP